MRRIFLDKERLIVGYREMKLIASFVFRIISAFLRNTTSFIAECHISTISAAPVLLLSCQVDVPTLGSAASSGERRRTAVCSPLNKGSD